MKLNKLQIPKEWWTKMVSGKMKYLFVAAEKGIKTGKHSFLDLEGMSENGIPPINEHWGSFGDNYGMYPGLLYKLCMNELSFGTAHLELVALNPKIYVEYVTDPDNAGYIFSVGDIIPTSYEIDKETYDFIENKFINKKKDFKVFSISDVKGII